MINPSAHGWVEKFFFEQNSHESTLINNATLFYESTRETGFLFGYITHFVSNSPIQTKGWTTSEFSKVALLNTLFCIYQLSEKDRDEDRFIAKCVEFYKELHPKKTGLLEVILPTDSLPNKLEKIISSRIQTNNNIISKNFSHILTNALLFIDVLAFKKYLETEDISTKYFKKAEEIIVNVVTLALKTKETKTKYDDLLLKLFESSVRYSKFSNSGKIMSLDELNFSYLKEDFEKFYLIDIAGMAMWSDAKIENSEKNFLYLLAEKLNVTKGFVDKSVNDMDTFLTQNKEDIPYFNYSNPVKHFYDQTTQNVQTLITRNKGRLLTEISQSKELMLLLSQSTHRELNQEEKKKVKTQLLDICKTIPSLTIFLVPGGSLLLPFLVKFIPHLLPSAFNENLDKTK